MHFALWEDGRRTRSHPNRRCLARRFLSTTGMVGWFVDFRRRREGPNQHARLLHRSWETHERCVSHSLRTIVKAFILAVVSFAPVLLQASDIVPVPGTQAVRPVFEASDLVCNCSVKSLSVIGQQPIPQSSVIRKRMQATVEIQDVYKSWASATGAILLQFELDTPSSSAAQPALTPGETAILFLKSTGPNLYEFTDPFLGVTPFHTPPPRETGGTGMAKLESALTLTLQHSNRDDSLNALRLLQCFDSLSQDSLAATGTLTTSQDLELALGALAVLLKEGTPTAAEKLKLWLESYKGNAQPISLVSVATELADIRDVRVISAMEALTSSRYSAVRRGAVQSLRKMRSVRSGPVIAQRLDDSDQAIQYLAVITLSEVLGKYDGDYGPSKYLFDKRPQYYIGLWKQWWADECSKLHPEDSKVD